jgi:prepilin-type processing-associated H-X9-DG protein
MNSNWGRSDPSELKGGIAQSWGYGQGFKQWHKTTDCSAPAQKWVTVDEHPGSINDAFFVAHPENGSWGDTPAFYHNRATSFSFADGHSEVHRWGGNDNPITRNSAGEVNFVGNSCTKADGNWYNQRAVDRSN